MDSVFIGDGQFFDQGIAVDTKDFFPCDIKGGVLAAGSFVGRREKSIDAVEVEKDSKPFVAKVLRIVGLEEYPGKLIRGG